MPIAGLVAAVALGLGAPQVASAEVAIAFTGAGDTWVGVRLTSDAEGGRVHVPAGTLLSNGGPTLQDLVLGRELDFELVPHETRVLSAPVFCLHSSRTPPYGHALKSGPPVDDETARLAAARSEFSQRAVQEAIWAYRDRRRPRYRPALKVFEHAGVVPPWDVAPAGESPPGASTTSLRSIAASCGCEAARACGRRAQPAGCGRDPAEGRRATSRDRSTAEGTRFAVRAANIEEVPMRAATFVLTALIGLGVSSSASAEVSLAFTANGSAVLVRVTTGAERGRVRIPAGTRVTTDDPALQELVLGNAIEVELGPHEKRWFDVPAFCVHSSRIAPHLGAILTLAGGSEDPAVARLLTAQGFYPQHVVQDAIWAYLDRSPPTYLASKVFRHAAVAARPEPPVLSAESARAIDRPRSDAIEAP